MRSMQQLRLQFHYKIISFRSNQSERINSRNTINLWNNLVPGMRQHEINMEPISHLITSVL